MSTEIWKPVVGFEGRYSVSSEGRIRRDVGGTSTRAGRLLDTTTPRISGYPAVNLCGGKGTRPLLRMVHVLVAEAHIGARPPGHEVNHLNSIRTDNRAANLEYVTRSGNMQHCKKAGRLRPGHVFGQKHGMARLTDAAVRAIRASDLPTAHIGRDFGVSNYAVYAARAKKTGRHVK